MFQATRTRMIFLSLPIICFTTAFVAFGVTNADDEDAKGPLSAARILFLGDSITYAGEYVDLIELQLRLNHAQSGQPARVPEIIHAGLPSENCTGLSEPDHPFPRPNVHERLQRALSKVKPDLVVACYGMNDGIYYPFSEERFSAYQKGIHQLIETVRDSGARLILLTPPPFDAMPLRKANKLLPDGSEKFAWFAVYENYDNVIAKYSAWLLTQSDQVDGIIDLHTAVSGYLKERRRNDPEFTMAPDGVHCNSTGHRVMADAVLAAWGIPAMPAPDDEMIRLSREKGATIRDAWLTEIGHLRPGVSAGLPLDAAQAKAAELDERLRKLIRAAADQ